MNKAELESKHLSDLHALAAEAGIKRFRMLSRGELIEKLSDGDGGGSGRTERSGQRPQRDRPQRRRRERGGQREEKPSKPEQARQPEPKPRQEQAPRQEQQEPRQQREPAAEPARPRRRRRRRRFGRRKEEAVTLQGLLLPPEPGRQAVLCAESREACTALLREVASDLAADSKGPDPIALLIDPSPEELADWRREAPQAEIVAAGQPRHATDALAQATARAGNGEDVILLVDSLTRLAAAHGDADAAKDFFDAGRTTKGNGTLTVVAAVERTT